VASWFAASELEAIFLLCGGRTFVRRTVAIILSIFLLAQALTVFLVLLVTIPGPGPEAPREPRIRYIEGGQSVSSSIYVYFLLMAGVALIGIAMKLNLGRFLFRNLELSIIYLTTLLLLVSIFPDMPPLWIIPPFLLVILRRLVSHWALSSSLSVFLAAAVGTIMGVSLGIVPVIALVAFLSVYDFAAVKLSGHMSNVVRHVRGTNSSFLIEIPHLKSAIGISDLAVPSVFLASNTVAGPMISSLFVAVGGALGLGLAIIYSDKTGMVPALPFIFLGLIGGYLIGLGA